MPRTAPAADDPVYGEIVDLFLAYESPMETVVFSPLFDRHLQVLSVTGTLGVLVGRDLELTVWTGTRGGAPVKDQEAPTWIRIAVTENGKTAKTVRQIGTDDAVAMEDEDEDMWVGAAAGMLLELIHVAGPGHEGLSGASLVRSYIQLNAACAEGLRVSEEEGVGLFDAFDDDHDDHDDHDHHDGHRHGPEWYRDVDGFTAQCRYGFLYQLTVQESPYGAADVSALIRPPGMEDLIPVKVFMHRGELETLAGHWYAAGDAMCPAHGQDVDIIGLVSGFPIESQGFIAHSLEHLHTTIHLVADILQSRLTGIAEFLAPIVHDEEELREMAKTLYATELADTLAGLNGIARMHTGGSDQVPAI